jgi:hypothetical protein
MCLRAQRSAAHWCLQWKGLAFVCLLDRESESTRLCSLYRVEFEERSWMVDLSHWSVLSHTESWKRRYCRTTSLVEHHLITALLLLRGDDISSTRVGAHDIDSDMSVAVPTRPSIRLCPSSSHRQARPSQHPSRRSAIRLGTAEQAVLESPATSPLANITLAKTSASNPSRDDGRVCRPAPTPGIHGHALCAVTSARETSLLLYAKLASHCHVVQDCST